MTKERQIEVALIGKLMDLKYTLRRKAQSGSKPAGFSQACRERYDFRRQKAGQFAGARAVGLESPYAKGTGLYGSPRAIIEKLAERREISGLTAYE